jgi:hypothetical protein
MRAYRSIAQAIAGFVVLQAAFIAYALFRVQGELDDDKHVPKDGNAGQALHGIGALVIAVLAIALLVTALVTKLEGAARRAGMVFGAVVLQFVLAAIGSAAAVVGALHGVNAFVVLGAAVYASRLAPGTEGAAAPPRQATAV